MGMTISYSRARERLAEILDEVEQSRDAAIIQRRGHDDVALVPADELESLRETAYLLRSPANAERLLSAIAAGRRGRGKATDLAKLRVELDLVVSPKSAKKRTPAAAKPKRRPRA